jgi:hypothetical protein
MNSRSKCAFEPTDVHYKTLSTGGFHPYQDETRTYQNSFIADGKGG